MRQNQKITSKINARIILSTSMTNILYSDYKINFDKSNKELLEFFNELESNNLLQIFKGGEVNISLNGSGFFKWDVFKKSEFPFLEKDSIMLRWVDQNEGVGAWINSKEMFAGVAFSNLISSGTTLPFLVYEIVQKDYTDYINIGSFQAGDKIPFWFGTINTPNILKCFKQGRRKHNYNRMSLVEVFNKNFVLGGDAFQTQDLSNIDFTTINTIDDFKSSTYNFNNWKQRLSDNYPVRDLENEINNVLEYFLNEMSVNRTKILSNGFSSQIINQGLEIEQILSQQDPMRFVQLINLRQTNRDRYNTMKEQLTQEYGLSNQEYYLMNSFIEISKGQDVVIDKMQSNFDGERILNTINKLFTMYFSGAGIDYELVSSQSGVYENSQASNLNYKKTIETIKMKKQLRERVINSMIRDIMYVWFNNDEDKVKSFDGQWKFEIISNLVNDEFTDINRVISLKQNELISKKRAISLVSPYLTDKELEQEIQEIQEDKVNELMLEQTLNDFEQEEDTPTQEERAIQNKSAKSNPKE